MPFDLPDKDDKFIDFDTYYALVERVNKLERLFFDTEQFNVLNDGENTTVSLAQAFATAITSLIDDESFKVGEIDATNEEIHLSKGWLHFGGSSQVVNGGGSGNYPVEIDFSGASGSNVVGVVYYEITLSAYGTSSFISGGSSADPSVTWDTASHRPAPTSPSGTQRWWLYEITVTVGTPNVLVSIKDIRNENANM